MSKCICKKCNKIFYLPKYGKKRYCSTKCKSKQIKVTCKICKIEFFVNLFKTKTAKFCSRKCEGIHRSIYYSGKNHPMYGKHLSMEHKNKMSKSLKGRKVWNKGKHYSLKHSGQFKKDYIPWSKINPHLMPRGEKSSMWKGGKTICRGYIMIYSPNHPNTKRNYVKRANLVMEKKIGRFLKPEEIVHHINKIRDDDRPENLELFANKSEHQKFHHPKGKSF